MVRVSQSSSTFLRQINNPRGTITCSSLSENPKMAIARRKKGTREHPFPDRRRGSTMCEFRSLGPGTNRFQQKLPRPSVTTSFRSMIILPRVSPFHHTGTPTASAAVMINLRACASRNLTMRHWTAAPLRTFVG